MAPARRPDPIQAIVGEDTYLAEAALEQVLQEAVGQERSEAVQVLYGDEQKKADGGGWAAVLGLARTGSLFAAHRAIVVRRADLFPEDRSRSGDAEASEEGGAADTGPRQKKKAAKDEEHPLIAYAADPSRDVTLVLVAARPDRRRNPWAKLLKQVAVHDVSPKKGRVLRAYVEQELRQRALRFTADALEELLSEVGQDLRRLMGEVDKLEAWTGGRNEIKLDDVSALLGHGFGQPLYRLSDAFAARERVASLELVDELLRDRSDSDQKEASFKILATLHRTLRQVRGAVALREAGTPRPQIGARLLPANMQFKLDALLDASRRWSERDLALALDVMGRTDRGMKRGADAAVALTSAIVASCGGAATSPRRAP
jgi:DNA polymerase III delta subunit